MAHSAIYTNCFNVAEEMTKGVALKAHSSDDRIDKRTMVTELLEVKNKV